MPRSPDDLSPTERLAQLVAQHLGPGRLLPEQLTHLWAQEERERERRTRESQDDPQDPDPR